MNRLMIVVMTLSLTLFVSISNASKKHSLDPETCTDRRIRVRLLTQMAISREDEFSVSSSVGDCVKALWPHGDLETVNAKFFRHRQFIDLSSKLSELSAGLTEFIICAAWY